MNSVQLEFLKLAGAITKIHVSEKMWHALDMKRLEIRALEHPLESSKG
jgi:hypothetical protein